MYKVGKNIFEYGKLLSSWNKITGKSENNSAVDFSKFNTCTESEKFVLQQVEVGSSCNKCENTKMKRVSFVPGISGRFHLLHKQENITLNCCNHCSGEIIVL